MSEHSARHHHHAEYFGRKVDEFFHPVETAKANIAKSYYAKSKKAYSLPDVDITVSKKVVAPKPKAPVAVAATGTDFTIPCHHIRVGDLVILQKRPCQIIRITTSSATGQHRYLGVDLFTHKLVEENCVVTHPSPSVVLHNMVTPSFKQYKVINAGEDSTLVTVTDSGEIKSGIAVVAQGGLSKKINEAYVASPGAVRVLVISDGDKELIVDFKKAHGDFKL
ncbi:hypothetical protein TWF730_006608 [Orbilia blumenaviensis]|uniref:Translation initiation factor 5A-like N-terminal domain-containing protein n=1 Tax=Orbilia blumenaviensis TaxID=1796055 RepID=A0AAV9VER4_9PEZI